MRRRCAALRRRAPSALCGLLIVATIAHFSWLAVARHQMFRSSAMDLGYTAQVAWNTLHGRPFEFTTYENAPIDLPLEQFRRTDNLLGYHVELLLAPIALIYLLFEDPIALLVLQVVVVALGALPAFWIARRRLESGWAGLAIAAAYLLAPALNGAVLSDFHAVALTSTLLLFAFYFLDERRPWAFLAAITIAISAKEDVPLLVGMLGLYLLIRRRERRLGVVAALLGFGWFIVATRIIQPHYNGLTTSPFLHRLAIFGPSVSETLANVVQDPLLIVAWLARAASVAYLSGLLATGGFLPLASPLVLMIGAPVLAINLFSTWEWTYSEGAHYSASLIPIIIVAAIYGAEWLARQAARRTGAPFQQTAGALAAVVLGVSLVHQWQIGLAPFARNYRPPIIGEHHRLGWEFARLIPPEASVSAQANLYPHIAHRRRAYFFPALNDAEYVWLDVTSSSFPISVSRLNSEIQFLLERGAYGVKAAQDGYLLLQRGAPGRLSGETLDAFLAFARADGPPSRPAAIQFGDALELVGFDSEVHQVVTVGQLPATVTTYWRALRPLDADYAISFFFTRPDGAIVGAYTGATPTLSWVPTRAWQSGDIMRVETPILEIGRDLAVLVGVSAPGAKADDPAARLEPTTAAPGSAPGAEPLAAPGTAPRAAPKVIPQVRLAELFRFGR